jgi:hypothetical protein
MISRIVAFYVIVLGSVQTFLACTTYLISFVAQRVIVQMPPIEILRLASLEYPRSSDGELRPFFFRLNRSTGGFKW